MTNIIFSVCYQPQRKNVPIGILNYEVLKEIFAFSFYLCNYLGSKISLLMWRFVIIIIIIKLTQWSANLSPSHSNFSFGIICGRLWGSLAVEDHLRSILGIICGLGVICGWGSFAVLYSYQPRPSAQLVTLTSTLIILDITKT